jgi:Putative adhesin
MDVPGISRPVLVALIAVAAALFLAGAAWAASFLTHKTERHTRTLPASSSIVIEASSGDIDVVGSDRTDVQLVTKERRSVFGRAHVEVGYESGRLQLEDECTGLNFGGSGCRVTYRVEVPRDASVRLVTHSGDVSAEDLGGDADLQTRSGDVDALDVLGRLRLHTTSGDVHVDSSSTDIDAGTTSGDVHVRARDATRVRAETTSGDVHVSVPDRAYAVQTRAVSGDEDVDVQRDDNSPRSIDASTTSGDVHVSRDG